MADVEGFWSYVRKDDELTGGQDYGSTIRQ